MNKVVRLFVFFMGFVLILSNYVYADETEENAFRAALALNYSQVSLARIVTYNDKRVLDQEYENILNNINLSKIKDEQIIDLLETAMDSLTDQRLNEGDKEWLRKDHERKLDNAMSESLSSIGSGFVGGGDPVTLAISLITKAGGAYFNYQNIQTQSKNDLERSKWAIEKETIQFLNDHRKDMLRASWELIQKYEFPDVWRLSESQINNYIEATKDEQLDRRFRKLKRLEKYFQVFPPYWYYLGKTAQDLGEKKDALGYYNKFEEIWKGIFRQDPFYASVCMNRIMLLDVNTQEDEILRNLIIIEEQAENDANMNLFLALNYLKLSKYKDAKRRLQVNVDNERSLSLSTKLMGDTLSQSGAIEDLETLIDKIAKDNTIANSDYLYLVGRSKEISQLNKIKDQFSGIELTVDTRFGTDSLILKLPKRWFYDELNMFLIFEGNRYDADFGTAKRDEAGFIYLDFEGVIEQDDFVDKGTQGKVSITVNSAAGMINFNFRGDIYDDEVLFSLATFDYLKKSYVLRNGNIYLEENAPLEIPPESISHIEMLFNLVTEDTPFQTIQFKQNIDKKKLSNAMKEYGIPTNTDVFALCDTTIFGSADYGMAFTSNGIYLNNPSESLSPGRDYIPYADLVGLELSYEPTGIKMGDYRYITSYNELEINEMFRFLKALKGYYAEYPELMIQ